ncbi:hypothetical protein BSKO_09446 [Bryopsis sp. KO-2023]|nr:hypothetical protein BSKO_09446 [Bryopsis sp. KO-2023]
MDRSDGVVLKNMAIDGCSPHAVVLHSMPVEDQASTVQIDSLSITNHGGGVHYRKTKGGRLRLEISNSVFGNGTKAAVSLEGAESVTISNSNFFNTTAGADREMGGCVNFLSVPNVQLKSSNFSECSAKHGGAISVTDNSGELDLWSVTVSDCQFERNRADLRGGGLHVEMSSQGAVAIESTRFQRNLVVDQENNNIMQALGGGGVYAALLTDPRGGGAPEMDVRIEGSYFDGNAAPKLGGGLFMLDVTRTQIESSNFTECKSAEGGGVWSQNKGRANEWAIEVWNSYFEGNMGMESGGGLAVRSEVDGSIVVGHSEFVDNKGGVHGGGMAISQSGGGDVRVRTAHSIFKGNSAGYGNGLSCKNIGLVELSWTSFLHNHAPTDKIHGVGGGGATFQEVGALNISRSLFLNNTSSGNGGGFNYLPARKPSLSDRAGCPDRPWVNLMHVTFKENRSLRKGGGLFLQNHCAYSVEIQGAEFIQNRAFGDGGAVVVDGEVDMWMRSSLFLGNFGEMHGGAVKLDGGDHHIKRCKFSDNQAGMGGGGINSQFARSVSVFDSHFFGNNATYGGAFTAKDSQARLINTTAIRNCHFERNWALGGGAICVTAMQHMVLDNSTFLDNSACLGGAVLFSPGEMPEVQCYVHDSFFKGNKAYIPDPQLLANVTPDVAAYTDFIGGGGAVAILNRVAGAGWDFLRWTIRFLSDTFEENSAVNGAGALLALLPRTESITLHDCRFADNWAWQAGGAALVDDASKVEFRCAPDHNSTALATADIGSCDALLGNKVKSFLETDLGDDFATLALGRIRIDPPRIGKKLSRPSLPDITVELNFTAASPDITLVGNTRASVVNGTATFRGLILLGLPGVHTLIITATSVVGLYNAGSWSAQLEVELRECAIAEITVQQNPSTTQCEHCPPTFFSFNGSAEWCSTCVANANCSGIPHLHPFVPNKNYWHSSPFSPQIHLCLHHSSCDYPGRSEQLQAFFAEKLPAPGTHYGQDEYPLCAQGSSGPLCGSCDDGYGHLTIGKCVHCSSNTWARLSILFVISCTVLFGVLITRANLPRNDDDDQCVEMGVFHNGVFHPPPPVDDQPRPIDIIKASLP